MNYYRLLYSKIVTLLVFGSIFGFQGRLEASPIVVSNFDDGTLQGWTPEPFFGGSLFLDTSGGNPGGFMVATDTVAGGGALLARAPIPLLGDLSVYAGFQWDEFVYDNGSFTVLGTHVRLVAADGTIYSAGRGVPPEAIGAWNTRLVPLDDPSAWALHPSSTGTLSFQDVVKNVAALFFSMDTSTQASGRSHFK